MTQHAQLITAMESRGGSITTGEILSLIPRIAQYNRVISDLRKKGYVINCEPILNQEKNNIFRLVAYPEKKKPQEVWSGKGEQLNLFSAA